MNLLMAECTTTWRLGAGCRSTGHAVALGLTLLGEIVFLLFRLEDLLALR
jgi:hypothetical protein